MKPTPAECLLLDCAEALGLSDQDGLKECFKSIMEYFRDGQPETEKIDCHHCATVDRLVSVEAANADLIEQAQRLQARIEILQADVPEPLTPCGNCGFIPCVCQQIGPYKVTLARNVLPHSESCGSNYPAEKAAKTAESGAARQCEVCGKPLGPRMKRACSKSCNGVLGGRKGQRTVRERIAAKGTNGHEPAPLPTEDAPPHNDYLLARAACKDDVRACYAQKQSCTSDDCRSIATKHGMARDIVEKLAIEVGREFMEPSGAAAKA